MLLRFNKQGEFISWMRELPKGKKISVDGGSTWIRTHDIKRVTEGKRKTAGGYQWKEVVAEDLTNKQ